MKKITTLFLLASVPFAAAEVQRVEFKTLQRKAELGSWVHYLPNQEVPFSGIAVSFRPDGRKAMERSFKKGKRDGPTIFWFGNGQMWLKKNYRNDKLDGFYTEWHGSGLVRKTTNFEDGIPCGIEEGWYDNGQKAYEMVHDREGFIDSAKVWLPNGEDCPISKVSGGEGVMVRYNNNGEETERIGYKKGQYSFRSWPSKKRR